MSRFWLVLVLLSSVLTLRAQLAPDDPPPADDGEWTTEATAADDGDKSAGETAWKGKAFVSVKVVSPPSEEGDEEDKPVVKTAVKPTATIAAPAFAREAGSVRGGVGNDVAAAPKKGKPKIKELPGLGARQSVPSAQPLGPAAQPLGPAVPVTPIVPRNP